MLGIMDVHHNVLRLVLLSADVHNLACHQISCQHYIVLLVQGQLPILRDHGAGRRCRVGRGIRACDSQVALGKVRSVKVIRGP